MNDEMNPLQAHFGDLSPRGRAVVDALADARRASTGFLLACGLLPEVNEACTEGLHDHVHTLSERHFDRERIVAALRGVLTERLGEDAVEQITQQVTTLLTADTTAAYLFGLAAGLGLGSLDRRLIE